VSSFFKSQSRWLDDPILKTWKTNFTKTKALQHVSELYRQWESLSSGPFSPDVDALWLEAATIMRDAGLPWLHTHVNMPEDKGIDRSWPFHFKNFERHVIVTKGARVGCKDVTGYIASWMESNQYGIRSLQQELRIRFPDQKPLLAGCHIESQILDSAAQIFGLDAVRVGVDFNSARQVLFDFSGSGQRPVIFAATLGNSSGQVDDFDTIKRLSREIPLLLHVDASRTFDYITTCSPQDRKVFGTPQLILRHPAEELNQEEPSVAENCIIAATIVAGGTNCVSPPPTAILKPRILGVSNEVKVEYVRGIDSTLCGCRDGIGPLWTCLQELRFGSSGLRQIFHQCASNRMVLGRILRAHGVDFEMPPFSLDIVIRSERITPSICERWGIKRLADERCLLTVQPSVTNLDLQGLVRDMLGIDLPIGSNTQAGRAPVCTDSREKLVRVIQLVVQRFQSIAPHSSGYPVNQTPYSALGPVLGHFLPIVFPSKWIDGRQREILEARKASFGILEEDSVSFPACFTTGSTMGNRVGIHTALAQYPDAYFYYSSATHYSIKKILRDNDNITHIWNRDNRSRFHQVPADDLGSMIPDELVNRALEDRLYCQLRSQKYEVVLLCNIGTTFVGGKDNIVELRRKLSMYAIDVAHIHVDGALDFGFASDNIILGPPGHATRGGRPVVQGITLSHHKVYGLMVSGEVICYNPAGHLIPKSTAIDPRVVFETWLFHQMYSAKDLLRLRQYCLSNANRLRGLLNQAGFATRFNEKSVITIMERIPYWLMQEFNLAPEGDWVHHISMPHITPAAVDHFVTRISEVDDHFLSMFEIIREALKTALGEEEVFLLKRLRARDELLLQRIAALAKQHDGMKGKHAGSSFLNLLKQTYIHNAMSFAAVCPHNPNEPLVVFLAIADDQRNLKRGPILIGQGIWDVDIEQLEAIGLKGFTWLADSMHLNII
jgi:hypothetical protein